MNHEVSTEPNVERLSQSETQISEQASKQFFSERLQFANIATSKQSTGAIENAAKTFRPESSNIEKFLEDVSIGAGLTKQDLDKIIQDSSKSADGSRSKVATFLKDHFNDICKLSANGGDRISRDDLTLYSQILKHSKKNIAEGKPPEAGLQDIHYSHEDKTGILLPGIGMLGGVYGADKVFRSALGNSLTLPTVIKSICNNPRTALIGIGVTRVASWLGGAYIGAKVGGMIDNGIQNGPVHRQFVDEAAPAMKRLLER